MLLKKEILDKRFYLTFLSEHVCNKNIKYEEFCENKEKYLTYYNQYLKLDDIIDSRIILNNISTADYHTIKKNLRKRK